MEIPRSLIIQKASGIITNEGIQALTLSNLASELNVSASELSGQLNQVDDIFLMLFTDMESNLNTLLEGLKLMNESPDTELVILFKKIYFLLLQKTHYLDLIFDKKLRERNGIVKQGVLRIRKLASDYLSALITKGKERKLFQNKMSEKVLTDQILSEFRTLMHDEHRVLEIIRQMKYIND
ncbi:MAG: hypothetical protein GX876_04655 [Bacteroidales bacterium]|nr:hypothetical protein [Bacteroidales bacterium]